MTPQGGCLPPVVFCPLLKKSSGNPYLKILDFSQLLVAYTHMNFFSKFFVYILDSTFGTTSTKIFFLKLLPFTQKSSGNTYLKICDLTFGTPSTKYFASIKKKIFKP